MKSEEKHTEETSSNGKDIIPPVMFNDKDVTPQSLLLENARHYSIDSVPLLKSGVGIRSYTSSLGNLISLELLSQVPPSAQKKKNKEKRFFIDTKDLENDQISLIETEVFTSFHMPGKIFPNDSPNYSIMKEKNDLMLHQKTSENNNRRRLERPTQTFGCSIQTTGTSTSSTRVLDVGSGCKLVDSNVEIMNSANHSSSSHVRLDPIINALFKTDGSQLSVSEGISISQLLESETLHDTCDEKMDTTNKLATILKVTAKNRILHAPSLPMKLTWMERALHQNCYYKEQLHYRAHPVGSEAEIKILGTRNVKSKGIKIDEFQRLFRCRCDQSIKRAVTSLCWNKFNKDILAAGYSSCKSDGRRDGKIMLWSITNSSFPENIINTWSSVTSIDYSNVRPAVLAVGMSDGTIAVFDTSKKDAKNQTVIDSVNTKNRHVAVISQVKWIDYGAERGERLVSISLDGRILEWYIQKGFCFNTLMVLKRITASNEPLNRTACGLCFDFPKRQTTNYIVASEDGHIYECSSSYNEQHLEAFQGHEGPVTQLRCSPFVSHVFLSCSNDWTVKLWSTCTDEKKALLEFHSMDLYDTVNAICWSNCSSTTFALVASDGRIEIWDLSRCKLNPILKYPSNLADQEERLTVLFGNNDKCLVTGNRSGDVEIFRWNTVQNSRQQEEAADVEEEAQKLCHIISKKEIKS